MESFEHYLLEQGKTSSTVRHYTDYVRSFLQFLERDGTEVDHVTAKEVNVYLGALKKQGLQNKTRSYRLGAIRLFFSFQLEQELRTDNPAQHIKIRGASTRKLHPILSRKDLDALLVAYPIPKEDDPRNNRNWFYKYRLSSLRNRVVLGLLINQGLSTPEVQRLKVNDLQLQQGTIQVQGSRTSNERTLELRSDQVFTLMEYLFKTRTELLTFNEADDDRLFLGVPSAGGTKAAGNGKLQVWKRLSKEIKSYAPKFINLKQVRASVITHWLGKHDIRRVQYMAGHKFVSSTEAYLVGQIEDLQTDIDQFHPLG